MRLCTICKQAIDAEREEALPETRLCTKHGAEIAEFGGEFIMRASQERTSKQGSMKLNYGGISTTKTRNEDGIEQLRDRYEQEKMKQ